MYLLITRISISLSGKSIVFAIAIMTTLAWGLLGHSNILQRTVCFFLQSMSSSSTRKMVWVRRGAGVENLVSSFFIACSCTNFSPSHFLSLTYLFLIISSFLREFRKCDKGHLFQKMEPSSFSPFQIQKNYFISFSIYIYLPSISALISTYESSAYSTLQQSTVSFSTVQNGEVLQYSTVQFSTLQYSALLYCTVQ